MHDGQNLFDPETAHFQGRALAGRRDRRCADRRRHARPPLIIVGIYNTGDARIHEYTPTSDARLGGGLADDYGRLLVEELKPFIDRTYRTRPDPASTGLGGSSLGGLVTLHLGFTPAGGLRRAGGAVAVGVVGPPRHPVDRSAPPRPKPDLRVWVDMGTAEGRRAWTMRGC